MISIKYSTLSGFQFSEALQKIAGTPTHGQKASAIHKIIKAVSRAKTQISKEYQTDIVGVWGKKDEAGLVIRPEGEPHGFTPLEGKEDEFMAAQEDFGHKLADLNCDPFTLQTLEDVKLSAQNLEALQELYIGNREDEGKPSLKAVQ